MPGPIFLAGEPVNLRTIEEEDLRFLKEHINDPTVWRAIGWPKPTNSAAEQEFFEERVCGDDSINLLFTVDEQPVGTGGFNTLNHELSKAELGYWVAPEYHQQGYGSAAVELLVEYGFAERNFHRIEAKVFDFNTASQRLLESVGFTKEGVHRDAYYAKGTYQDVHWYGLLEDEWDNSRVTIYSSH